MTFLKNLWADLVEKKLWPVALLMLVALVAVPVALGGAGGATAAAPLGATGATGASQTAQIALDPSGPTRRDRAGAERDPFKGRKVAEKDTGGKASAAASSGSSSVATVTGDGGGGAAAPLDDAGPSGGSGDATPDSSDKPEPREPDDTYVVEVRFGKSGAARTRKQVGRLTPLPSADNPLFVYLGALSDKRTAVFLLPVGITATGDGSCKPRASSCETVELRAGDTEFLDVTDDDGVVTQYQLDVVRVFKEESGAPARAVAARSSDAPSGDPKASKKADAADEEDELGSALYSFDDETGLLTRVKKSASRGHAAVAATQPDAGRSGDPAAASAAGAPPGT